MNQLKKHLIVCSILLMSSTSQLFAVEPFRTRTPIISGTQLQFPTMECSAGLVFKRSGFFNNLTPYLRSVRYVLTAGHCGNTNDVVRVANRQVGQVVWKSPISDLALVVVPPVARHHRTCSALSTGITCSISSSYEPLALGRVFVSTLGTSVAVDGIGEPGDNEVFCTSGAFTGINCSWGKIPNAPVQPGLPNHIDKSDTAQTFRANVEEGDSGGPVINFGMQRKFYGIISMKGHPLGASPNNMKYVPIRQFFTEYSSSNYEIAPSQ